MHAKNIKMIFFHLTTFQWMRQLFKIKYSSKYNIYILSLQRFNGCDSYSNIKLISFYFLSQHNTDTDRGAGGLRGLEQPISQYKNKKNKKRVRNKKRKKKKRKKENEKKEEEKKRKKNKNKKDNKNKKIYIREKKQRKRKEKIIKRK